MKKSHLSVAVICSLSLLLLSGCYKDGDGKLELKEPKKELRIHATWDSLGCI